MHEFIISSSLHIRQGGTRNVMVTLVGNNTVTRVQIQEEFVCISHTVNIVGKSMNPTILPPAIEKIVEQTVPFNLGMANGQEGKL